MGLYGDTSLPQARRASIAPHTWYYTDPATKTVVVTEYIYYIYCYYYGPTIPTPTRVTNTCPASILAQSLTLRDTGRKQLEVLGLSC